MAATDRFARRATLARSLRLLGEFRFEQRDPARFYRVLARDTAAMVSDLWWATNCTSRPAGRCSTSAAGPATSPRRSPTPVCTTSVSNPIRGKCTPDRRTTRHPRRSSAPRGWRCRSPMPASTSACRPTSPSTCRSRGGWAARCCASPSPAGWRCCRTRCGWARSAGMRRVCGTTWAGARAAARYARKHGHPAKNDYGSSLFAVSAADGLQWGASSGALIAAFPRYHPRWAWWMTKVPLLREFMVSNLVLVLRPPRPSRLEHVLVLASISVGWRHDAEH